MSFPPSAACKFLDLPPVNLRDLHLHLTKNPFASRPPHLCGVTLRKQLGREVLCKQLFAEHAAHAPSVSSKLLPKQRMEKAYCLLAKQMLIATGNFHGGGSPEGAVAQTWTFDSPLWALFGYFLSQQKVTESLPQKRLKPRKKSSLLLKSRKTHPKFHPIFRQQPTKKPSAACICRASVL